MPCLEVSGRGLAGTISRRANKAYLEVIEGGLTSLDVSGRRMRSDGFKRANGTYERHHRGMRVRGRSCGAWMWFVPPLPGGPRARGRGPGRGVTLYHVPTHVEAHRHEQHSHKRPTAHEDRHVRVRNRPGRASAHPRCRRQHHEAGVVKGRGEAGWARCCHWQGRRGAGEVVRGVGDVVRGLTERTS